MAEEQRHDNAVVVGTGRGGAAQSFRYSSYNTSVAKKVCDVRFIRPPIQRQRWDDDQVLPHVNWGDLFFDLFYVAAAYNLSAIILKDPSADGLLYFICLFGPIMSEWFDRQHFDATVKFPGDPIHRFQEVLQLCLLATAVVHIRPVDAMSHPSQKPDMFAYSLAVSLLVVVNMFKYIEIYCWVDGEEAAKKHAIIVGYPFLFKFVFYLAAAIISGTQYLHNKYDSGSSNYNASAVLDGLGHNNNHNHSGSHRYLLFGNDGSDDEDQNNYCSSIFSAFQSLAEQCGFFGTRFLSEVTTDTSHNYGSESSSSSTNVPAWLCFGGYLFYEVFLQARVLFCLPGGGRHKTEMIPMNIDYTTHRYGEWTMLLLGEGILSLLIVDTSITSKYYISFYSGILSVISLQYLHFRSQPHHANDHALRRSAKGGSIFVALMQVYSFALVSVGVSYKLLLYEYIYERGRMTGRHRSLRKLVTALRNLAGGTSKYSSEERRPWLANFFCEALAVAFLCLELMILTHRGIRYHANQWKKHIIGGSVLVMIRVGLIIFISSLGVYFQEPDTLALIGLAVILAQVLTRIAGDMAFPHSNAHEDAESDEDSENESWPNVTHARAEHTNNDKNVDKEHGEHET